MRKPLSFVRRSNRLIPRQQRAWDASWGQEILAIPTGERDTAVAEGVAAPDWKEVFGRGSAEAAPLIVEIGSGSGEAILEAAAHNPEVDFLACEVYRPGAAQLAVAARRRNITNVRILCLDAFDVLTKLLPQGSVSELWLFFPDPWPKKKHHKRRIVQPDFVDTVAQVVAPGGIWRLATDWSRYAEHMREVLAESDLFHNPHQGQKSGEDSPLTLARLTDPDHRSVGKEPHPMSPEDAYDAIGGWAPRFEGRVITDFERKAKGAGREIFDLNYMRRLH